MSKEFLILIAIAAVVVVIGEFVSNKILNKGSDAIHNRSVRKKNRENPSQPESLADRYNRSEKP